MTFRVNHESSDNPARCPYRVVVQATGREIDWINQYLDYETVRRLADHTLQSYANELLYFLRWWESVHHTDTIAEDKLTESTLLDYVRFLSGQQPPLSGSTINTRVAIIDKPFAIYSLMRLIRLPRVFKGPIGNVHQWALANHDLP